MNAATATLDPSAPGAATPAPGAADATASTALTTGPSRAVEHIRNAFEQPTVRKALPAVVVFALIVVLALAYSWMQAPQYRAVMPGMQEADLQNAYDALKQGGFSPQLDEVTGQLKVTQDQYHQARIYLAGQGIPKNLPSGLDALSTENSMTTSQFMEQARYNAMMEQELARSVAQIAGVRHARVHLATPKQSVFVRDRTPPKASVVITRYPGRMITEQQVQAIVHLVSFSVPYMAPEHVTVVDNFGSLMTRTPDLNALGLTEAQSQHKAQLEELYRERIVQILNPVVGETNVRSQVNLTLDFTEIERTTEDYDNNQKGPKTRSEVLAEDRNANQVAAGVPGSTTNVPPPNAAATQNTNVNGAEGQTEAGGVLSSRTTRNYELDRSVQRVKRATGTVQRVSVAVVINERKAPVAEGEEPAP
ncbi:MAG: Flagellar M-ring protein, partial [Pseudomonadota bacterium]